MMLDDLLAIASGTAEPLHHFPAPVPRHDNLIDVTPGRLATVSKRPGAGSTVNIAPSADVLRSPLVWAGGQAEIVHISAKHRVDIRFQSSTHLLVLHDRGSRRAGESHLEGVPVSRLRDFGRRLTLVPAGHRFHDWLEPQSAARLVCFYFSTPELLGSQGQAVRPRLFFEDGAILDSMRKLHASLELPSGRDAGYLAALGTLIAHEVGGMGRQRIDYRRGGLAPWQQRLVAAHIDEHLTEPIRLNTLADLARLSTHHFCRAFKRTFGVPPHRYHTDRRIECAKDLLAARTQSITEIGLSLGYCESSSFTVAFRKATGLTPTAYRQNLG